MGSQAPTACERRVQYERYWAYNCAERYRSYLQIPSSADYLSGYWFSSHEQWKVLEMPYYDVDLVK